MAQRPLFNLTWAALGLMACTLAGCATTGQSPDGAASKTHQAALAQSDALEAQRLEKFAVSQCLMRAFPDTLMAADAGRASGAYVELGTSTPEAYEAIVDVVQAHHAKPYNAKSGKSLFVMQCLDLLDDPALKAVIWPDR